MDQSLSHYRVLSLIGAGGMGEVYLAEDTRLGRKVALKLLPKEFTEDPERVRRFELEARAASSLNHPNILTIFEVGQVDGRHFIATEYIDGQTLRERLSGGQLEVREALDVAAQIASALEAAHAAGIVHRDIKPENVIVRPDGLVKVLDFGLAKLAERQSLGAGSEAMTLLGVETTPGLVLGTVSYMSPEQARGLKVDARSDNFSLGVVIYEMVAGRCCFEGATPSDVIAAILQNEPLPLARFAQNVPAELERIVAKALCKDREERYQTARELSVDLKSLKQELEVEARLKRSLQPDGDGRRIATTSGSQAVVEGLPESAARTADVVMARRTSSAEYLVNEIKRHRRVAALAAAAVVVTAVAYFFYQPRGGKVIDSNEPARIEAGNVLRSMQITTWSGLDIYPALSPDGNSIAYSSDHNGSFEIYVKPLTPVAREIQLTSDGTQNFEASWSPDGRLIAYYSENRGGICLVPASGGTVKQLTEFGSDPVWSPDGSTIAFQSLPFSDVGAITVGVISLSTLWTVPSQGGDPTPITQVGNPPGGHGTPSWSPDGKRIIFFATDVNTAGIYTVSASGNDLKQITASRLWVYDPIYSPDGKYIYYGGVSELGGFVLYRLRVSPANSEAVGEPVEVANTVLARIKHLTISADGKKLAYSAR